MNTIIKWYYKTKLFWKPRVWPFCRVKGCWEKNCEFAGIRATMCSKHACEKMLEALLEVDEIMDDYYWKCSMEDRNEN